MSRKTDLEQLIRDSYGIIHDYEQTIQTSDRPDERLRARREIDKQWAYIAQYWQEYRSLTGQVPPPDVAEIVARVAGENRMPAASPELWLEEEADVRSYMSPIGVLRKLDDRHLGLCPRRVKIRLGARQYAVFLLEQLTRVKETVWVAPSILFDPGDQIDSALYQQIYDQMTANGDPGKLAELFEQGERAGQLDVHWETNQDILQPYKAQVADIQAQQVPQEPIVKPA